MSDPPFHPVAGLLPLLDEAGSNRLPVLAAEIAQAHARCQASAAEFAQQAVVAGQGLIEAKGALPHGAWLPWLLAHLPGLSVRTAQRYMRAAEVAAKNDTVSYSSLRELIAHPRPVRQDDGTPDARSKAPSSDWWRPFVPAEGERNDNLRLEALVTILDELRWRPGEIADELSIARSRVETILADDLRHLPLYDAGKYSKRELRGPEGRQISAERAWGLKFDGLLDSMVEAYCHWERSLAYAEATSIAHKAGKQELVDICFDGIGRHYCAAHSLYAEATGKWRKPTTPLIAGVISKTIWLDRARGPEGQFHLCWAMVAWAARLLLGARDKPQSFDLTLFYGFHEWPGPPLDELTIEHFEWHVRRCLKTWDWTHKLSKESPDVFLEAAS
jgi:hypothetical protein